MNPDTTITLGGLLSVIESTKPITINLYNQDELLLITFVLDGYSCLEDVLEQDPVTKIVIKTLNQIDITIDTTNN